MPISGPTLQEKLDNARQIDNTRVFTASNGWLKKFKARHNISYRSICGESASVNPVTTNDWLGGRLPSIIALFYK